MNNSFNNDKFNDILDSPYTLYGQYISFNNNKVKEIITNRITNGTIPLYPDQNIEKIVNTDNFLISTRTRENKSANNSSSIDYNRWEVFVNGKNNPVTAFEFMDNNLRR